MSIDSFSFQGISISAFNQSKAVKELKNYRFNEANYVCFPDSYTIFSATKDNKLREILNNAYFTMPDGKPLEFFAKRKGIKNVSTVSGFWTCKALLSEKRFSHFFYGSNWKVLKNMKEKLHIEFPEANILGFKSPPLIELSEIEQNIQLETDIEDISKLNPDYLWIGLSSPKQDYLMAHYYKYFSKSLLLGIGGVFEYLSGDVKKSPEWIKKIGLRWLYRLVKEPRRLWRKYWFVIKGFISVLLNKS